MSQRLFYTSDLHNEAYRRGSKGKVWAPILDLAIQPDVIVLAGDIDQGVHAVDYANALAEVYDCKVILVPGNHEYWAGKYPSTLDKMRERAGLDVVVLNNETVVIGGVRYVGATLWTDGCLWGRDRLHEVVGKLQPLNHYDEGMGDYLKIRRSDKPGYPKLRPSDTFNLHAQSLNFIKDALAAPDDGPTVVVTHHAPSKRSLPDTRLDDVFSAAYASDLESLIESNGPEFWVHGHIHESADYKIGNTRIMSNPGGGPLTNHLAEKSKGIELSCKKKLKQKH